MTEIRNPPGGPFVGDVEPDLVPRGVWFGKAAYHFADPEQRAEVDQRRADIGDLGAVDRDESPLLTAVRARALVNDYDDEAFRTALRMYAAALGFCGIKLSQKIMNGQVAICRERVAGDIWTWIPVREYTRLHPDEDDPTIARGGGVTLRGVLAFDVAEVMEWLVPRSAAEIQPVNDGQSNEPVSPASAIYSTGVPGRPTALHLVVAELRRCAEVGDLAPTLKEQATLLIDWLRSEHVDAPKLGHSAAQNGIRAEYRRLKTKSLK